MKNAEDLLQVWGFEENTIIYKDGSLGSVHALSGINGENFSDEKINSIRLGLKKLLNNVAENTHLQFIFEVTADASSKLTQHELLAVESRNSNVISLTEERIKRLRVSESPRFNMYLVLRSKTNFRLKTPGVFSFKKPKEFENSIEEHFKVTSLHHKSTLSTLLQNLRSLEVEARELTQKEIFALTYNQWNPVNDIPPGFDASDAAKTLMQTDIVVDTSSFAIGDTHHRVLSVKTLPDHTVAGVTSVLTALPIGCRLFVTIFIPEQLKEISKLKTDRRVAHAMVFGRRAGVSDLESAAKLSELESLLEELITSGERIYHVQINAVLRSKEIAKLDELSRTTINAIRMLGGAEMMAEFYPAFSVFADFAFPNAVGVERMRKLKTSNLSDLLPLFSPWEGAPSPVVLFKNAVTMSLFSFDPFDSTLTNFNQLISGGSGAGKSYMTNFILLQALSQNPYMYFVDIGGSYKKLAENLGGAYIPLALDSGIAINPFDLKVGEVRPSDQKIKFLVGLVEMMTKEDERAHLPRLVRSEIELAVRDVYEKTQTPRLSDLQCILSVHPNPEIVSIAKILATWCGDSAFGRFLDRPSNISLYSKITAFDLKGLEQFPDIQGIALYIITDLVWRQVQALPKEKKFVVFDECWRLLKNDAGVSFIEDTFRTFRKHNASAIAISQDIDDFAKSKISTAILPNCSVKWIMMQPQADGARLKELLNLNDNEVETIKTLSQEKGRYSEVYLIAQDKKAHLRIEATPLEYWIATTDARDLTALLDFEFKNPNLNKIQILRELSTIYPQGVAAAAGAPLVPSNVLKFPGIGEKNEN